jgi:IPT/TIG domain
MPDPYIVPGSETRSETLVPESSLKRETFRETELVEGATPTIISIEPSRLPAGGEDTEVLITGTGFTPETELIWNRALDVCEFIDEGQLRTTVKPSTVGVPEEELPFSVPVTVRNGPNALQSNGVFFSFDKPVPVIPPEPPPEEK